MIALIPVHFDFLLDLRLLTKLLLELHYALLLHANACSARLNLAVGIPPKLLTFFQRALMGLFKDHTLEFFDTLAKETTEPYYPIAAVPSLLSQRRDNDGH